MIREARTDDEPSGAIHTNPVRQRAFATFMLFAVSKTATTKCAKDTTPWARGSTGGRSIRRSSVPPVLPQYMLTAAAGITAFFLAFHQRFAGYPFIDHKECEASGEGTERDPRCGLAVKESA
jgi:hypothetical protein